eukprot:GDKI01026364.1.p1 GENE.GDKI01026364.1~~GDKI01026364.1.p1  ORF type:complete len:285 (+),score=62.43 GDKI01026364.1:155-1009(+)
MPKNASLFGKYLRLWGKGMARGFKKGQITKPIPVKAYGRPPSASSQMGLYHDEDFNYYTKTSFSLRKFRQKVKPLVFKKDFVSDGLNTTVKSLRVTTSALHAMDDMGGFDQYILRTPPQELRSNLGEKMREVMYFYQQRPDAHSWGLPWKVFLRKRDRDDPYYARHLHYLRKSRNDNMMARREARYSPYYLPGEQTIHPERQPFIEGSDEPKPLNLWWKTSPELEAAFRRRLGEAKSFEQAYPDFTQPDGYKTGEGMGGGGQHGNWNPRKRRSKTYKWGHLRPI